MHAFLSPSKYHWINYDEDKLDLTFIKTMTAAHGSRLHEFAAEAIRLKIKLLAETTTIGMYVNDAIGLKMNPEQMLFFSENCFGTADAIGFRRNKLRVHDLKNGVSPTSEKQLEVYCALFCLEYRFRPFEIEMETRIYQSDESRVYFPDPVDISMIMDKIKSFDKRIKELRKEAMM